MGTYNEKGKYKKGIYFLFNDLFLFAKPKGSKYILLDYIELVEAQIRFVATYGFFF